MTQVGGAGYISGGVFEAQLAPGIQKKTDPQKVNITTQTRDVYLPGQRLPIPSFSQPGNAGINIGSTNPLPGTASGTGGTAGTGGVSDLLKSIFGGQFGIGSYGFNPWMMLVVILAQYSAQYGGFGTTPPKVTEGNPSQWYFQHGQHSTTKTDYGWIDEGKSGDSTLRIVYNSKEQTGYIYKKAGLVSNTFTTSADGLNATKQDDTIYELIEVRKNWGGKSASPIILDLDGNGKPDVADGEWKPHADKFDASRTAMFDINGTGKKVLTEWVGPNDGLLVQPDKDGKVTSGNQLFGTAGGNADGYEKLQKLDAELHGGVARGYLDEQDFETLDKQGKGLKVWQDKNTNAETDAGELKSLKELGITRISTTHKNYQSSFVINGQERKTWDWWPTYMG